MRIAIIGGGPCGTYLAYMLSKKHQVHIFERDKDLGGCWATHYDSGYFQEHSPRIMFNNYVNTRDFFEDIGIDFYDEFFKVFSVYEKSMKYKDKFTINDIFSLTKGLLTPSYFWGGYSVKDMCDYYSISSDAVSLIQKMCYGIDGVSYDKMSAKEYFETIDSTVFSTAYEPKTNSDVYLVPRLKRALRDTKMYFNYTLDYFQNGSAFFETSSGIVPKKFDHYIVCIPPVQFAKVMRKSDNTLLKNPDISNIARTCQYTGIGVQFHFNEVEPYEFPEDTTGDWHIIASYNRQSKCLSCVIVDFNLKSKVIGLTVNECNKNQIMRETWRQLKEVVDMKRYEHATITKNVYKLGDEYTSTQGSYFRNKELVTIESNVGNRVSYVGSHNTRPFPFTSYESAIQSAKLFLNNFEHFDGQVPIYNAIGLKDTLTYSFFVILILYFVSRM